MLLSPVLLVTALLAAPGGSARVAERPNIVFIIADDLGKEWLSCYGGEEMKTPHIDSLAAGGIRFDNAYATPLCTPSRVMLLTGRYPFRTGWVVHYDVPRWGGVYFDWQREITFARVLKSAGYATALAGKWQLNDFRVQPDALKRHGFDEHCLWPGFETGNAASEQRYFDAFIQLNGARKTYPGRFGPNIVADFLDDFIWRHKDGPFLAYYPLILPHSPMTRTPHNPTTQATGVRLHPGMVEYVDYLVGRVVRTLDELGLRDKTLIVFTGDNGSPGLKVRMRGRAVVGGKSQMTEPGICVPFVVNWPKRVPAGRQTDELIDFSDIMPTLAEYAGAKLPDGVVIDGRSFADIIEAKSPSRPCREWIFSELGEKRAVRDKRYKLLSSGAFFDLREDPGETHDLAASKSPEVVAARARLVSVLKSLPPDVKLPFPPRPVAPGQKSGE